MNGSGIAKLMRLNKLKKTVVFLCLLCAGGFVFAQANQVSQGASASNNPKVADYERLLKNMQNSSTSYHEVLDKANIDFTNAQNNSKYGDYNNKYIELSNQLALENTKLQEAVNGDKLDRVQEIEKRKQNVSDLTDKLDALLKEYGDWVNSVKSK